MSIYQKQKGIAENYTTFIQIEEVNQNGNILFVKSNDGKNYSHFINEKNEGWEKHLKAGNLMSVYVRKTEKGNKTYRNIYPDITSLEPLKKEYL